MRHSSCSRTQFVCCTTMLSLGVGSTRNVRNFASERSADRSRTLSFSSHSRHRTTSSISAGKTDYAQCTRICRSNSEGGGVPDVTLMCFDVLRINFYFFNSSTARIRPKFWNFSHCHIRFFRIFFHTRYPSFIGPRHRNPSGPKRIAIECSEHIIMVYALRLDDMTCIHAFSGNHKQFSHINISLYGVRHTFQRSLLLYNYLLPHIRPDRVNNNEYYHTR